MSSNPPNEPDEDEQDTDRQGTQPGGQQGTSLGTQSGERRDGPQTGEAQGGTGPQAGSGSEDHGGSDKGIGGNYEVLEWLSLDPEEEVVWVGEPSMSSMIGTIATGVLLIPFLIGILILMATPFSYLSIKKTDFVVTNKSLYAKKGVLSTNIETVDLDKIQNTEYSQSFWGKQLGYGNIEISTAGSSGTDITFQAIENARAVRERISELSAGAGTGGSAEDGESATSAQLDELVIELRATRQALERVEDKMGEDRSDGHSGQAGGQRQGDEETGTDHQQD